MSETATPPAAPPTTRGRAGRRAALPINRVALWSMICGIVGLVIFPLAVVAIWLGIVGVRRVRASQGREQGIAAAVVGICAGGLSLIALPFILIGAWSMVELFGQIRTVIVIEEMRSVQQETARLAQAGAYPVHVAAAIVDPNSGHRVHRKVAEPGGRIIPGDVMLGTYDFADYDGSDEAKDQVRQAIDELAGEEPFYQFGRCWFARLPAPTNDAAVIFAWYGEQVSGYLVVVMDDGSARQTQPDEWSALWAGDAAARTRLGLPAVKRPEVPQKPTERQ